MKKIHHILFFSLLTALFVSCERADYYEEIKETYREAERLSTSGAVIDGNMWSARSEKLMTFKEAEDYCYYLDELGYHDWRPPTVDELRTLIQNCNGNEAGGACSITDDCILHGSGCGDNDQNCRCCEENYDGSYSKIGDSTYLWSSLPAKNTHPDRAWIGCFSSGCITTRETGYSAAIRCVR